MVDTRGAGRNQARNILRDGVIFDSSILAQFKGTLYECIAERRQSCEAREDTRFVSLTGQRCNHFWRWCGREKRSARCEPVN